MVYRSIPIEKGSPGYAVVNPNTNIIYISYSSSNFILAVDLKKGTVEAKIPAKSPGNIVVNNSTNNVYISSEIGIYEIDGIDNQYHIINVGLPRSNGNVDINPLTNLIYTTCFGHDIVTVIDIATRAIAVKIPVGKNPIGVTVDSASNMLYVANNCSQSISVIDCHQSNKIVDTINLASKWHEQLLSAQVTNPIFVFVNEIAKLLYVTVHEQISAGGGGYEGNTLLVIEIDSKKCIRQQNLPSNTGIGFAFNKDSSLLYIRKKHEKAIQKFDAHVKKVIRTIALEKRSFWQRFYEGFNYFAEAIAINPSTNKVYVSDSKNNLLYEIDV